MTYASSTWTLTQKHEKMVKTTQRKMLRLIVQTKRRYKSKKMKMDKKEEGTEKAEKMRREIRPTKRQTKARNRTQKKTKIVMCPSRKMPTKKLTPLKMKKTGLITSKEARMKLRNTWKSIM